MEEKVRDKNINQTLTDTSIGLMRLSSLGDGPIYFEIDEAGMMNVKEGFAPDDKKCTEINDKSFVHQNDEKTL